MLLVHVIAVEEKRGKKTTPKIFEGHFLSSTFVDSKSKHLTTSFCTLPTQYQTCCYPTSWRGKEAYKN